MYRVVSNEALRHLQWIVVRDDGDNRPVMCAGPFTDERTALLHCGALNRQRPALPPKSSALSRFFALVRLVNAGWLGERPQLIYAEGAGMTGIIARRLH